MRIALDASCLGTNGRGFARYVQAFLQGLEVVLPSSDTLVLFSDSPLKPSLLPPRFQDAVKVLPPRRFHGLWRRLDLPGAAREAHADLLHFPDNACVSTGKSGLPTVATVHDISPLLIRRPRLASAPMRLLFRRALASVHSHAGAVIAVSERDRKDLEAWWQGRHPPVHVVLNGIRPPATTPPPSRPEVPYFLFVGALEARKNLANLLAGFTRFKASTGRPHRLVLIGAEPRGGGRFGVVPERITALKASCPARDALDFRGPMALDDPRLAGLYRNATALCLVSWYETFGFPWVEAMAYDCPVIATTAGAGPEIVGEAGLLCDPSDPDAIASALTRMAKEPALSLDLVAKGRCRVRRFGVEAMAKATLAVYRELG